MPTVAKVQSAMRAEVEARDRYQSDQSNVNQMRWTAARMESDAAWAALWELGRGSNESAPDAPKTGLEWVANMRRLMERPDQADSSGTPPPKG